MSRGYLSFGAIVALGIAALTGFPLDQFTRPLLIVVVLALVLSIILGTVPLTAKLLVLAIGLGAITIAWDPVSGQLRQTLIATWADPEGRWSIVLGVIIFLGIAGLFVAARVKPGRSRKSTRRKLTGRSRVPVMLPERTSSFDLDADVSGPKPTSDDFGLLSGGQDEGR